jgi:hypothetical protein
MTTRSGSPRGIGATWLAMCLTAGLLVGLGVAALLAVSAAWAAPTPLPTGGQGGIRLDINIEPGQSGGSGGPTATGHEGPTAPTSGAPTRTATSSPSVTASQSGTGGPSSSQGTGPEGNLPPGGAAIRTAVICALLLIAAGLAARTIRVRLTGPKAG